MKSFNKFINEAKKDLPKGNPGNLTASDIKAFKNVVNTGERPKNLSTDLDTSSRTIRKRSSAGTSWEGDPKAIEYAKDLEQANKSPNLKGTADTVRTQTKNPTVRQAASNILGGGRAGGASGTEELVGKGAPTGTGQAYRDTTVPQQSKPAKPKAVSQRTVSRQIAGRLKKYRETKVSASQLKQFRLGQTKGYIGKTGTPTAQGIQTYTTRRATRGFGDAGYNPTKRGVKDPLASVKSVDNIVSRAAGGDKAARSEVKRSYKAMTSRYKDIVPSSQRTKAGLARLTPQPTSPAKVEPSSRAIVKAKVKVDPPKAPKSITGSGGPSTTQTLTKTKTKPQKLNLLSPPKTSKGASVNLGGVVRSTQSPSKGPSLDVSTPPKSKVTTNMGGRLADTSLADKVKQARQKPSIPKPPKPSSLKKPPVSKAPTISDAGYGRLMKAINDPNYTKGVTLSRAEKTSLKALKDAQKQGLNVTNPDVMKRFTDTRGTPKGYEASRQATKTAFRKASATQRAIQSRQSPVTQAKAQAGIQRGLQKSATSSFYKGGGFKTGAAGLAGLAGYGAYKQEKARGASDARASLRGAVKGAGAYLGAKGGYKLAAKLSRGGGAGRALAGAVLGFTALSQLADKGFKAFAGATAKEKAAMNKARGNAAPSKASRRWTSSNPLERFGRTVRQSKIPVLSGIADKYFKSRGG